MDVIAMHRAHHDNCIALMGTALTKDHLRMLKRMTRTIHLCLDGDMAGQARVLNQVNYLHHRALKSRLYYYLMEEIQMRSYQQKV